MTKEPSGRLNDEHRRDLEDSLRKLLGDLATGSVTLRRTNSRASIRVRYEASNGWKLSVFNDVGVWDYLETAEDPSGRILDFHAISAMEGINWKDVYYLPCWGDPFLMYREFDPEFPDREMEVD